MKARLLKEASHKAIKCICQRRPQSTAASPVAPLWHEKPASLRPPPLNVAATHPDQLHRAYNLFALPPLSSYAALSARIPALAEGLRRDLALVEQCCVCASFWAEHRQTSKAWLRDWQPAQATLTHFCDDGQRSNAHLAVLGNELLGLVALEWLEHKWPHLPTEVLKAALSMYVGSQTCADVARGWGITPGTALQHKRPTGHPGQPSRGVNEGRRAGNGTLRWARLSLTSEDVDPPAEKERQDFQGKTFQTAMAASSRAFVGAMYQTSGFEAARSFIQTHFLSRQADLASLLKFSNPKALLFRTLQKYSLGAAQLKLLKESGRQSHAPVFVVGAFDGADRKLGEGMGSSLRMAEFRAAEDALRRIYLQRRDARAGEAARLPSDTLCGALDFQAADMPFGDDEVEFGSSGRSGRLAASWERQPWQERDRVQRL